MTPTEAREIIGYLDWNQTFLADLLGRDSSRTRKQFRGAEPFDQPLADWLAELGRLLRNPPRPPAGSVLGLDGECASLVRSLTLSKESVATFLGCRAYGNHPEHPVDLKVKAWLRQLDNLVCNPPPKPARRVPAAA